LGYFLVKKALYQFPGKLPDGSTEE